MSAQSPDREPVPAGPDALAGLREAGFPVDLLPEDQIAVLADLSADELTLLVDLKRRLDAAEPEVQAHVTVAGAGLF